MYSSHFGLLVSLAQAKAAPARQIRCHFKMAPGGLGLLSPPRTQVGQRHWVLAPPLPQAANQYKPAQQTCLHPPRWRQLGGAEKYLTASTLVPPLSCSQPRPPPLRQNKTRPQEQCRGA